MQRNLENFREEYSGDFLDISNVEKCPISQFSKWFKEAEFNKVIEPNIMSLSTIDKDNFPLSRIVLLKSFNQQGFTFFTNYESSKGQCIAANNKVSLNFFWQKLSKQVNIVGTATKVDEKVSDKYFLSRPFDSQIGAWSSPQSQKIANREILEERKKKFEQQFKMNEIHRPAHWGGYIVAPIKIEFWQGQKSRLHDRIVYEKKKNNWDIFRVAP